MIEYAGLVGIDLMVLLATVVNFIIFFLILKHFFYEKVKDILAKRQDDISAEIAGASEKNAEAAKLKQEYEGLLADIRLKEREIIRDANVEAQAQKHEIIEKAHEDAKLVIEKAMQEIELEKRKAMNEVKSNIVDLSLFAAEKIIHESMDQKQHEKMILDFIDKVGEAK
ncbi:MULTISPECIES: F0F1 ATP synthase subunit B [Acetobacterium]|jgi:F-type H+-transporting ATPase subunit b|uniref:F0F1 ATP synthase subunit B n=1 Tax=Acetobacterium TaxID=33951 RepID=UPI000DBEB99F|nr:MULTISPECIES: F0F1 ATP synthase subunit B [unclassified Acetobacterium]AWW27135.1 ATP synthase F0 subunit B [Acetobacterium sp. KB-1]MDZ5724336.1 F0F1 ATP synthase subunit B [Acetobacterium sp. K1/6]